MNDSKQPNHLKLEDYNGLIDIALAQKDKKWFEELVKRQKRLREMEIEARRLLGVID